MALIVACVVWENVTSLMRGAKFWERWENTQYPDVPRREQAQGEDGSGNETKDQDIGCGKP